jgi:hypothetical protein
LSQTKYYVCLGWCRSWVQALVESHQRLCLSWMLYIMGSSPGWVTPKTMFVLDAVYHGFKPWLSHTQDYVCLGCCRSWVHALVESHQRLCLSFYSIQDKHNLLVWLNQGLNPWSTASKTNIVFGVTQPGLEPMIYSIQDKHSLGCDSTRAWTHDLQHPRQT